ncbi:MAG: hypothetical protein ACLQO7_00460, partial [Candidatus Bathyarchaeia archaeon]
KTPKAGSYDNLRLFPGISLLLVGFWFGARISSSRRPPFLTLNISNGRTGKEKLENLKRRSFM